MNCISSFPDESEHGAPPKCCLLSSLGQHPPLFPRSRFCFLLLPSFSLQALSPSITSHRKTQWPINTSNPSLSFNQPEKKTVCFQKGNGEPIFTDPTARRPQVSAEVKFLSNFGKPAGTTKRKFFWVVRMHVGLVQNPPDTQWLSRRTCMI